jgi:hypothetical protein
VQRVNVRALLLQKQCCDRRIYAAGEPDYDSLAFEIDAIDIHGAGDSTTELQRGTARLCGYASDKAGVCQHGPHVFLHGHHSGEQAGGLALSTDIIIDASENNR